MTVRAYAEERLRAEGEWEEARARHAQHYLRLAETLLDEGVGRVEEAVTRVEADHENLRAALGWAWETGATAHGLRMVRALWRYWFSHSPFLEGLDWLRRFIARSGTPATTEEQLDLAEAWTGVLAISHRLDRYDDAIQAAETALALRRAAGEERLIAMAQMHLALAISTVGEYERAIALLEECLAMHHAAGRERDRILALLNLGGLQTDLGKPQEALACYEESLALSRSMGESDLERALTWTNLGEALIYLDDARQAVDVTEPSYRIFCRAHDTFGIATSAFTLGRALWRVGDLDASARFLDEAERLFRMLGNAALAAYVLCDRAGVALDHDDVVAARRALARAFDDLEAVAHHGGPLWRVVERTASLATSSGQARLAAHLYGASATHHASIRPRLEPAESDAYERDLTSLRAAVGQTTLTTWRDVGAALDAEGALALVREVLRTDTPGVMTISRTGSTR